MKAVIYARYSSDNQREESIEGQIRECTAFAEKNNITILRHYIDRAFSAKTDNRPEFQDMIKDSGKRLFDMIIVWKLDRFARNRYDSARYKTALKKNGVKVVSATEVISDGAEGIILESVLEGYAEYYSADLSEKVVRGMTENALKSKYNGGTRPIGYLIDSDQYFQLDPLTAPFVREAFQRYDEGATMTAIRDWLNEQGVKNTRGQKMTYNSVQHLLNNRRYIGEYTYRDIVVPDGIPAIVPRDLFDRVQEKLAKNKKAPARHKAGDDYLLTTKLFCGYCGAYLCGESGTSHTGNVHHYYKCVSVKKKRTECHKKSVRKEWIEDLVVSETMKMVMDDEMIEAIVSMLMALQDRENVNLPLYEQQLREVDTAIQNLLNAIQQGILTKSTKGRLEELEATKEELETKIACEKMAKPKVSSEFMTFWLHRFRKLDVRQKSHRKMLIDIFINAIFLYDDKMVITFNYKEGTTTITFDDLKTALADQKTGSDLDCSTAPKRKTRLWEELRKEVPPKTFVKSAECNRIAGNFNISEDYIMDKTIFEQMGGTYHQEGDYFLPDLPPPESIPVGVWGQRRRQYLKTQRRVIYTGLLLSGKLDGHLAEIDAQAEAMLFQLVNQLAEQEGITEQLKAENQMEWVQRMNNIRNRVEEIIYNDLIYI